MFKPSLARLRQHHWVRSALAVALALVLAAQFAYLRHVHAAAQPAGPECQLCQHGPGFGHVLPTQATLRVAPHSSAPKLPEATPHLAPRRIYRAQPRAPPIVPTT